MTTKVRAVTYVPDRTFEKRMEVEPSAQRYMGDVAQHIVDRAVANMPRGFMGTARHMKATKDGAVSGGPAWHLAEFGTPYMAPRAPIRRAVESLGLTLEKGR